MTNLEHNAKDSKQISQIINLDPKDSFFVDKEVAGFYYTMEREGSKVREIYQRLTADQLQSSGLT